MPIQLRGPSPKGKYGRSLNVLPREFASLNRSELYSSGSGKYFLLRIHIHNNNKRVNYTCFGFSVVMFIHCPIVKKRLKKEFSQVN